VIFSGDLKKGKKALRVTIEYNIPVKAPTASLKTAESERESCLWDLFSYIFAKWCGIISL
jgi:hypothetical protein